MKWVEQTLSDFGKRLGVEDFSFNNRGIASFQFLSGCQIVLEEVGDDILIYQISPTPHPSAAVYMRALRAADFREGSAFPWQVGMRDTGKDAALVVLVRMASRDFTLQTLEQLIETLQQKWLKLN